MLGTRQFQLRQRPGLRLYQQDHRHHVGDFRHRP